MSLIKNIVKRIETLLSSPRPNIPPAGTDHVNDSGDWTSDSIYPGELAIQMSDGNLFTSDGEQAVELNKLDGVLSGLEITTSGVSLREVNLSSGTFRINGRTYKHVAEEDTDDATILTDSNIMSYSRLDAICVKGDLNFSFEDFYGADFKVFKGVASPSIPLPIIDEEGWIFLGFVLIVPNQTVSDVLRPLSIQKYGLYPPNIPINVTPSQFEKDLISRVLKWEPNTLYLKGQVVEHDNNLYHAAYTHVSDSASLTADFNADKIVSLGAVTSSNFSRFSHIGSSPTTGSFSYFTDWNSTDTRIMDAFQDLDQWAFSFAPTAPVNIDSSNLRLVTAHNKAGFTDSEYDAESNFTLNLVPDDTLIEFDVEFKFTPYSEGALKSYLYTPSTSYSTDNFDLTSLPLSIPDTQTETDPEDKITLTIIRDDHYGTTQGYKGFYKSIEIKLETLENLTADSDSYRARIAHLSSDDYSEVTFYVESVREPSIDNVTNITAISNAETLKYMSGVPILDEGDQIEVDYEISDAVRYFYNHAKITELSSEIMSSNKVISFADSEYFNNVPPLALPADPSSDGAILELAGVEMVISDDVLSSSVEFTIKAYNAMGESAEYSSGATGFLVDSLYTETGVRRFSGAGSYPAGSTGVDWGQLYDQSQSEEDLFTSGNYELQFFGGKYFYPKINYSAFGGVYHDGDLVNYPDYSNDIEDVYRWATFKLEDIEAEKFYNLEIRDTNGITYDLDDGITVTNNFKMFLKVVNTESPELGTGWIDLNKAYNSTLVTNPASDGDPGLDLGWMEGYSKFRRATFGTIERTGEVWVRIGTSSKTISFKDAVRTAITPELNDSLWDQFILGNILGESYVIISINGTNNTFLSDFLNGTTMTSNLDLQIRVFNAENPALGTDWIDANEAYPANGLTPYEYGDPALDLTYYTESINPALRKITFGPTTRTGELQARIKISGGQSYTTITKTYPAV